LAAAVAALAADPPPGTYLETCTAAAVAGDTLTATCKRADGSEQPASLDNYQDCKGDIWNNDGTLGCPQGNIPAGRYTESCEYVTVVGDVLSATCRAAGDTVVSASLPDYKKCVPGTILNINGRLVCDSGDSPKGAYSRSCVGTSAGGGKLTALCETRAGTYQSASLGSYERCLPGSIVNANGTLACDWTEFPAGSYTKSCFFKKTNGSRLTALCLTRKGELQATSLADYASCAGGISNVDGDLMCGP
jgi:hypothetical protein